MSMEEITKQLEELKKENDRLRKEITEKNTIISDLTIKCKKFDIIDKKCKELEETHKKEHNQVITVSYSYMKLCSASIYTLNALECIFGDKAKKCYEEIDYQLDGALLNMLPIMKEIYQHNTYDIYKTMHTYSIYKSLYKSTNYSEFFDRIKDFRSSHSKNLLSNIPAPPGYITDAEYEIKYTKLGTTQ